MKSKSNEAPQFATFNEVVMKKGDLLKALNANKEKHDTLFEVSVSGYWELATQKLAEKKIKLKTALKEFEQDLELSFTNLETDINRSLGKIANNIKEKEELPSSVLYSNFYSKGFSWDNSISLTYPVNHSDDYARVISMMDASIYDTVKLSTTDYDRYVLNNWEWKNQFVSTANFLLQHTTGCYYSNDIGSPLLFSGYAGQDYSARNDRSVVNF